MGGMAFCPRNYRNKENIYKRRLLLFKWDVINSHAKEKGLLERGMRPQCVWMDRYERV